MTRTQIPLPESLKPQYWPVWLGLGIAWTISRLPYPLACKITGALGSAMYYLVPSRRKITLTNLRLCFPEWDESKRIAVARANFRHLGYLLSEAGFAWWRSEEQIRKLGHITGHEHLDAAYQRGKGVILLTAHMTSLELGGQPLGLRYPAYVMYKRSRNALTEAVICRGRERFSKGVFLHSNLRKFLAALKDGDGVWYAPDQDFGIRRSVFAPFFGVQTATLPTTANLASKTGAAVVPFYPVRRPDHTGIDIVIMPELTLDAHDDVAAATQLNESIEQVVRQHPEQYMWLHRRFKSRPPGEPELY